MQSGAFQFASSGASSHVGVLSAEIIKIGRGSIGRLEPTFDPVEPDLNAVQPPEHRGDVAMDAGFKGSHARLEGCHSRVQITHHIAHHVDQIVELVIQPAQSAVGQVIETVCHGVSEVTCNERPGGATDRGVFGAE